MLRVMMGCRSVSALSMERVKAEFGSMMPIVSLRDCARRAKVCWKRGAVLDFVWILSSISRKKIAAALPPLPRAHRPPGVAVKDAVVAHREEYTHRHTSIREDPPRVPARPSSPLPDAKVGHIQNSSSILFVHHVHRLRRRGPRPEPSAVVLPLRPCVQPRDGPGRRPDEGRQRRPTEHEHHHLLHAGDDQADAQARGGALHAHRDRSEHAGDG